mmetsp:Transcript_27814/g.78748  ORF Transcript_27814/g.78748 Transcript_27814/m.78748 type:complete len:281 (+) Transcript_27814:153-995(+)
MCHSWPPSFSCASIRSSCSTRNSTATSAKATRPQKAGVSSRYPAPTAASTEDASIASGGSASAAATSKRWRITLAREQAKENPRKAISMAVATAMSMPLVQATEPARPMSMPSMTLSKTTAMIRPQGTFAASAGEATAPSASAWPSMAAASGGDGPSIRWRGTQRRKVARSVCRWTLRNVAATVVNCLSMACGSRTSISRIFVVSRSSSAVYARSRWSVGLSIGSAPRQRRRAESTRKSMPWISSSSPSLCTSSDSTHRRRASECCCSREKVMRSLLCSL